MWFVKYLRNSKVNTMKLQLNTEDSSKICGKCQGWCCKHYFTNCDPTDDKLRRYWEVRALEWFEYGGKVHFIVYQPCDKLDKKGKCTIYKERPQICREFPTGMEASVWAKFCPLTEVILKQRREPVGYRLLSRRD